MERVSRLVLHKICKFIPNYLYNFSMANKRIQKSVKNYVKNTKICPHCMKFYSSDAITTCIDIWECNICNREYCNNFPAIRCKARKCYNNVCIHCAKNCIKCNISICSRHREDMCGYKRCFKDPLIDQAPDTKSWRSRKRCKGYKCFNMIHDGYRSRKSVNYTTGLCPSCKRNKRHSSKRKRYSLDMRNVVVL